MFSKAFSFNVDKTGDREVFTCLQLMSFENTVTSNFSFSHSVSTSFEISLPLSNLKLSSAMSFSLEVFNLSFGKGLGVNKRDYYLK